MENLNLAIAVCAIEFLNFSERRRLYQALLACGGVGQNDCLEIIKSASYDKIASLARRDANRPLRIAKWNGAELVRLAKKSALEAKAFEIKCALHGDPSYPPLLREIPDPPFALFYRGSLEALFGKTVSVVGTRRLCAEGRKAARDFAYKAASEGFCVVSGLAMGADGFAHQGAVDAFFDGKSPVCLSAAALAGGVDSVFPSIHKKIAARLIQNGGCVLSECPPGIPGQKWRFVSRNRIIAALSPATVVIQAPPGSGAMITADFALEYNRELFFHQACFCKAALTLSQLVRKNLEGQAGAAAARKIQSSPEAYVEDGARVIANFEEFRSIMY